MSYAIVIAPDAYSQWRALDPVLQELTLDELDAIAANPPTPPDDDVVRDFAFDFSESPATLPYLMIPIAPIFIAVPTASDRRRD
jgi:hypothetical protein